MGASFLALCLSLIAFYSLHRTVVQPLAMLRDAVTEFGETHVSLDLPKFQGSREISEIAAGFSKMTHDVADYISGINQAREELKQSEQVLKVREARIRSIIKTASDGIITIDTNGTILIFSPAAKQIFTPWPKSQAGISTC